MKKKAMDKLSAMLTPETSRQPRLTGESWNIMLQPDLHRADQLCVGVAVQIDKTIYCHLIADKQIALLPLSADAAQCVSIRLNTIEARLSSGNPTPPPGVAYTNKRPASGDSPAAILDMLWQYGPGLLSAAAAAAPSGIDSQTTPHGV